MERPFLAFNGERFQGSFAMASASKIGERMFKQEAKTGVCFNSIPVSTVEAEGSCFVSVPVLDRIEVEVLKVNRRS
jgi:hypothetical protein